MKSRFANEGKPLITGWDIGGAHLKMAQCRDGEIVSAKIFKTPLWLGLDQVRDALSNIGPLQAEGNLNVFTMTGELSDTFTSRDAGIAGLLNFIGEQFGDENTLVYAGRAGFCDIDAAHNLGGDIASANWHATASLGAKLADAGLFIDMGSTTTDILAFKNGELVHDGYSDAERLLTGELVYTGFTRSALIGVAALVPVRGQMTPLMNEYFANTADLGRILGTLDEVDDKYPSADRQPKTVAGSIQRLARMVGRDGGDLEETEWTDIARWFSEHQLRMIHDGAFRVARKLMPDYTAPIVGAGIGRPQIKQLAKRMDRPYIDFGTLIPATADAQDDASKAAPAAAVALLASMFLRE
ncbi:hydantoinase/oxoprolinase family protein [Phyllobacterium myrsinacearum]|uniref:Putative H4MPT-linked C1 transfer pathway protein n=1 Tax=Phyllobacterium myrsinacearum TaxID=28101 RepID=A0A839EY42_9HYPH|nr:hydantoinase/oxoprolinase family protein [Phyllobacterium myrsinacearum]MBA8881410.1 putative H4MPT-linked C1 transfer pathway protein [Phyllobacterium myrsinacearum]